MAKCTHEGYFILKMADSGVSRTKKSSLPQFAFEGPLVRYYDQTLETWVEWEEYEQSIGGYMVLVSNAGEDTLNVQQVMKATGWDGESFKELGSTDYKDREVMVRCQEQEYENKVSMQVTWIDDKDAEPGSTVQKLEGKDLDDLDKEYKRVKKTVASKRTTRPKTPSTKGQAKTPTKPKDTPTMPKKTETPVMPSTKSAAEEPKPEPTSNITTKVEAWEAVCNVRGDAISDVQLETAWNLAIADVNFGDEDKFEASDWSFIFDRVAATIGTF